MPVLTIRLPAELHERFLAECEKRDIKASELGRKAIEAIVDRMIDQAAVGPKTEPLDERLYNRPMLVPKRLPPGVRGYALDGSPIVTKTDRLKK